MWTVLWGCASASEPLLPAGTYPSWSDREYGSLTTCAPAQSWPLTLAEPVRVRGERLVTARGVYAHVVVAGTGRWVELPETIEPALLERMRQDARPNPCPTMRISRWGAPASTLRASR